MAITVVVADDHGVVRRGLRALLESERDIAILAEAADGRETIDAVERCRPDVLILDLMMPTLRGLDVLRALAARKLPTRVVVLSMHAGDDQIGEALRAGAIGYVVKDAAPSAVVHAVREAAAGRRFLSEPLSGSDVERYLAQPGPGTDSFDALSTREREVLLMAAQGLTNQQIADRLAISRRTAETHRANLMRKLGLRNQKDLIRFALRRRLLDL